ncbi:MAG: AarF/ABC1/UbiB kinase family protein [Deltaproteobacteria bacterium]|nr:AarF/ABC1/UbiB kinase family protein [Deltaproteobacteria bacterium]
MLVLAIVLAVVLALWALARYVASRRNAAGIATSIAARAVTIGGLATRSAARKAALRVRQVVASKAKKAELEHRYHMQNAAEITETMGQMKGVFMKLGQILSFAKETLPPEARKVLEGLQKDAPPMAFELVKGVVEGELGRPISDAFATFDEEPLAAASIGQVHRARLPSGEDVVVKVQYPGVAEAIRADLRFTGGLVQMVGTFFRNTDAEAMVKELADRLGDELDYRKEADNQEMFRRVWEGHPLVRIPRVHRAHSGARVLTQDYHEGLSFYDFLDAATPDEKRLAMLVLNDFVFDSMHLFDMFNGDPHPGNYLFHPDGAVTFLDFGCVKRFAGPFMDELRALNQAIVEEDRPRFEDALRRTGVILPGRPLDPELSWSFFEYHARPFAKDRVFTFDEAYLREAGEVMRLDNLKRFNLPADLVFFNRITFGLNAIFQKLGASENFHRYYRRYIYRHEGVRPSLAQAGVSLPERFLDARAWPIEPLERSA